MSIQYKYEPRPIRFLEVHEHDGWHIKIYSISLYREVVQKELVDLAKLYLTKWLQNSINYPLETYKIATLILHEGRGVEFAVINWWIDENMLQNHVYLLSDKDFLAFTDYSRKGMMSCVWELEVLWFERNNWVEHVLANAPNPNYDRYLKQHLNKH